MTGDIALYGRCPACGRHSLRTDAGGEVACGGKDCPRPSAAQELLLDTWMNDHVVELRQHDFTLQHPLIERLDDGLFRCELNGWLARADGPPHSPGRYRMTRSDPGWRFEPLDG